MSVEIHRHKSHTGQCFLESTRQLSLSATNPTSVAWLTCDLKRAEDFYKLCLRAGKTQGIWPKRRWWGQKAVPNGSASSNCSTAAGNVWKAMGLRMQVISPWASNARAAGHHTAPPFNASPPAPPAKAARSQPAASRVTGEATNSPKGVMNAFLWPLPAHWHTSAHICPAARAACSRGMPGDTSTGKGHCSLTFRIRRCLDRSANPCAFASLCHACRWSGGLHPLRYGRDIRHSWCLTLSPSGTFSP